ncbi:MAG: sulfide/dihydroorotate dehydrogenase-like FAD/NAD-binding protein [Spirochaetes bacterium]|nr:sulfide/dihydroorotate dehydrogenase-like FAD/NAD-binding protein [Spirochaetota bacterium]
MIKIIEKYKLGPGMNFALLDAPLIAESAEPGQFVIVTIDEKSERIPLTIADFDRENKTISIVFQEMGKGTHRLANMQAGDFLYGVLGPQGNPSVIHENKDVIIIGGGIGIAPVFPIARKLTAHGNRVTSIIGYRNKDYVFWEDKMNAVSSSLLIATNDGSYGEKGFVTDLLKKEIESGKNIDEVIAIGPPIMMKAVSDMTREHSIKTIVSLNSLMVCGMGMCGACRVTVNNEIKFTCMDGPEFDAHQVDFNELMQRLGTYKNDEQKCFEDWQEENNGC